MVSHSENMHKAFLHYGYFGSMNTPLRKNKKCKMCGTEISNKVELCKNCYDSIRKKALNKPNRDELKVLIRENSFCKIGTMFNVTDNAVRKWCKGYNLPFRKKDINAYSDEE